MSYNDVIDLIDDEILDDNGEASVPAPIPVGLILNAYGAEAPQPSPSWGRSPGPGPIRGRVYRGPPPPGRVHLPPGRVHPPPPHIRQGGGHPVRRPPPQKVILRQPDGTARYIDATFEERSVRVGPPSGGQFHRAPPPHRQRMPGPSHPSQRQSFHPPPRMAPAPLVYSSQVRPRPPTHPQPRPNTQQRPPPPHSSIPSSSPRQRVVASKSTSGRIQTPYQRKLQEKKQGYESSRPSASPRAFVSHPAPAPVYLEDDDDDDESPDTEPLPLRPEDFEGADVEPLFTRPSSSSALRPAPRQPPRPGPDQPSHRPHPPQRSSTDSQRQRRPRVDIDVTFSDNEENNEDEIVKVRPSRSTAREPARESAREPTREPATDRSGSRSNRGGNDRSRANLVSVSDSSDDEEKTRRKRRERRKSPSAEDTSNKELLTLLTQVYSQQQIHNSTMSKLMNDMTSSGVDLPPSLSSTVTSNNDATTQQLASLLQLLTASRQPAPPPRPQPETADTQQLLMQLLLKQLQQQPQQPSANVIQPTATSQNPPKPSKPDEAEVVSLDSSPESTPVKAKSGPMSSKRKGKSNPASAEARSSLAPDASSTQSAMSKTTKSGVVASLAGAKLQLVLPDGQVLYVEPQGNMMATLRDSAVAGSVTASPSSSVGGSSKSARTDESGVKGKKRRSSPSSSKAKIPADHEQSKKRRVIYSESEDGSEAEIIEDNEDLVERVSESRPSRLTKAESGGKPRQISSSSPSRQKSWPNLKELSIRLTRVKIPDKSAERSKKRRSDDGNSPPSRQQQQQQQSKRGPSRVSDHSDDADSGREELASETDDDDDRSRPSTSGKGKNERIRNEDKAKARKSVGQSISRRPPLISRRPPLISDAHKGKPTGKSTKDKGIGKLSNGSTSSKGPKRTIHAGSSSEEDNEVEENTRPKGRVAATMAKKGIEKSLRPETTGGNVDNKGDGKPKEASKTTPEKKRQIIEDESDDDEKESVSTDTSPVPSVNSSPRNKERDRLRLKRELARKKKEENTRRLAEKRKKKREEQRELKDDEKEEELYADSTAFRPTIPKKSREKITARKMVKAKARPPPPPKPPPPPPKQLPPPPKQPPPPPKQPPPPAPPKEKTVVRDKSKARFDTAKKKEKKLEHSHPDDGDIVVTEEIVVEEDVDDSDERLQKESSLLAPDKAVATPIHRYYYAYTKFAPSRDPTAESLLRYKCPAKECEFNTFYDNISVMRHLLTHVSLVGSGIDEDIWADVTRCNKCFSPFNGRWKMQKHEEKEHSPHTTKWKGPHRCKICERDYDGDLKIKQHMRSYHVRNEMPYVCPVCSFRTSIYNMMIDHFVQRHNDVNWALCPFCFVGFRMSPGPEGPSWGSTMKYFSHLMIHKSRKRHRCQQCRLSFVLGNALSDHMDKDHRSFHRATTINHPDPTTACDLVTVAVSEFATAHLSSPAVPENSDAQDDSESNVADDRRRRIMASVVINLKERAGDQLRSEFAGPGGVVHNLQCIECQRPVNFAGHFRSTQNKCFIGCDRCSYITSCSFSYSKHVVYFHGTSNDMSKVYPREKAIASSSRPKEENAPSNNIEKRPMAAVCVSCGFHSRFGNVMSEHLAREMHAYCLMTTELTGGSGFAHDIATTSSRSPKCEADRVVKEVMESLLENIDPVGAVMKNMLDEVEKEIESEQDSDSSDDEKEEDGGDDDEKEVDDDIEDAGSPDLICLSSDDDDDDAIDVNASLHESDGNDGERDVNDGDIDGERDGDIDGERDGDIDGERDGDIDGESDHDIDDKLDAYTDACVENRISRETESDSSVTEQRHRNESDSVGRDSTDVVADLIRSVEEEISRVASPKSPAVDGFLDTPCLKKRIIGSTFWCSGVSDVAEDDVSCVIGFLLDEVEKLNLLNEFS